MSAEVKAKVDASEKIIKSCEDAISDKLKSVFGDQFRKAKFNKSLEFIFGSTLSLERSFGSIVLNKDYENLSDKYTTDDFYIVSNPKVENAINKQTVIEKSQEYLEVIEGKLKEDIFDEKFTYFNLKEFFASAKDNNYFDDKSKRLIKINNVEYGESELQKLIDNKEKEIFGSPEGSSIFESVRKDLSKNKETSSLFDFLKIHSALFAKLSDYKKLCRSVLINLFGKADLDEISVNFKTITEELAKISSVINEEVNDTKLVEIWGRFKKQFSTSKFDLDIKNKHDSYLGINVPVFCKTVKGTNREFINPQDVRFSTGEIRTCNFINLILEIESRRDGKPMTIILDDAAESFDYKNKYGIIDYISNLAEDNNLQLIVLTHNFDFYRSSVLATQKFGVKQFFAYRNSKDEVSLVDSSKNYYLNVADFNGWKNCPKQEQYLGLVGFCRQIIQFQTKSDDPDVQSIDNYLHFVEGITDTTDFVDLNRIMSKCSINLPKTFNLTDKYLETLVNIVSGNTSKVINETDLEYKLVFGLGMRILFERIIFLEYKNQNRTRLVVQNQYRPSKELIKVAKNLFNKEDYLTLVEINSINPSFIHVNSFMYEPLIDVGAEKLIELTKWLLNKNAKYPM